MDTTHHTRTPARVPHPVSQDVETHVPAASGPASTLDEIKLHLEIISSTVAVAVGALEGQGADLDHDIANTLRTCVRSALADQIDRLTTVIDQLN
jgi:hypothetical protein